MQTLWAPPRLGESKLMSGSVTFFYDPERWQQIDLTEDDRSCNRPRKQDDAVPPTCLSMLGWNSSRLLFRDEVFDWDSGFEPN